MTGFSEKVAYGIFLKIRKSCKKIFIQLRFLDTGFLTSLCLFLPIKFLKSYRRLVCQRLMGPLFVIEAHILVHTFSKICLRGVVPSIRFFPLKRSKECLGHCVVTGTARAGEGLLDAALLSNLKRVSEVYCPPRSLWKVKSVGLLRARNASLNVAVTKWVLHLRETRYPTALRENKSIIAQRYTA